MRALSENFGDIVETVRAFNQGLAEGQQLENQLSYFRAWYYIPELDMVGPSKFVGYKGMTAAEYMSSTELDGKVTEPALSRWFDVLQPNTPEGNYVENLVEELLARHNKAVNRKARFLAPHQWHLTHGKIAPSPASTATRDSDDERKPIVEVFWRAFLGLYPEDQEALARRITTHVRHPK
jgi:hypothetical protein